MVNWVIHWVKVNKNLKLEAMKLQLIEGTFSNADALHLIEQIFQTKIKFHESKIAELSVEEDIKSREGKIKALQQELAEFKQEMKAKSGSVSVASEVAIQFI